ncbi:MAG: fatty acid desaturase family protein [Acidimicrobiales bacterium]
MSHRARLRLYRLTSPACHFALDEGLTKADWYRSEVPRARLKPLTRRSDMPALRDTLLWAGLGLAAAALGVALWGTWGALPCFVVYGVLYGSASDARWHEMGHGTAFRTRWMDAVVYQVASFCMMRDPTVWRWQHARHHTETLIVGRDPEITAMRPARLARIALNLFGIVDVPSAFRLMVVHAFGKLTADEATFVPVEERAKVRRTNRVWLAIYAVTVVAAGVFGSWLPVVLVGGPRLYGAYLSVLYGLTQHAGLGENVLDHRLNTRTVLMNPVNRFLYLNMNYHTEHHMFPMVPYHQLPSLHEEIMGDLPAPYPSMWAAYKEIVPAILRQLRDPTYFVKRELPPTARPYHGPVDGLLPDGACAPLPA